MQQLEQSYDAPAVEPTESKDLVPAVDELFVPLVTSKMSNKLAVVCLFPSFTGLSGNGKHQCRASMCTTQVRCRCNITIETDEDDLIGGFRLVNGTVWHDGPVVEALKRGVVLLLDEVDLASNKIMCSSPYLKAKVYTSRKSISMSNQLLASQL